MSDSTNNNAKVGAGKTALCILGSLLALAAIAIGVWQLAIRTAQAERDREAEQQDTALCELEMGRYYLSEECMYMVPLSSFYPFSGDSGCRYTVTEDAFLIENSLGDVERIDNTDWTWKKYPYTGEQLSEKLFGVLSAEDAEQSGVFGEGGAFIRAVCEDADHAEYIPLSSKYELLRYDNRLCIAKYFDVPDVQDKFWSIYSLRYDDARGCGEYEYRQDAEHLSEPLCIELRAEQNGMNVSYSAGSLADIALSPLEGYAETADSVVYWYPTDDSGNTVPAATIAINPKRKKLLYESAILYINRTDAGEGGSAVYRITAGGNFCRIKQDESGRIIVTLDGYNDTPVYTQMSGTDAGETAAEE